MDTLSHGLWALAIFWGTTYRSWAFLIGILPDLLSFGLYFVQRIITGIFTGTSGGFGRPHAAQIPDYVDVMYNITHSFFTWILIGVILYIFWRRYWPIVFAAMAHIALDIPTHSDFFPTPFLWPFSDYQYHGMSWGTPWIFALNWICLVIVFALIFFYERGRKPKMSGPVRDIKRLKEIARESDKKTRESIKSAKRSSKR